MGERVSTRWYGRMGSEPGPKGRVQIDSPVRNAVYEGGLKMPESVLRLAQAEYEHLFGTEQDYETMQDRGGLSVLEVVALLADYVERLGGKPTTPRGGAPDA